MTDLRYPIGTFERPTAVSAQQRAEWIAQIADTPARLRAAVAHLSLEQLDTPYRPGGWTVRQVVHHVADSHLHSYIRFRRGLTEEQPTVRPYDEKLWAELPDAATGPVEDSLDLLIGLHKRWVRLLQAFAPSDWSRTIKHLESGLMTLDTLLALYAWHGRHHVAHVSALRERMGWQARW